MAKHNNTRRGFSVIELVVVLTILVLLAGVLVPIVSGELSSARITRAQTDMKTVADAFARYKSHTGAWPANDAWNPNKTTDEPLEGFACLYVNTHNKSGWAGPYLNTGVKGPDGAWALAHDFGQGNKKGLMDPWGNPYRVYVFGRNGSMGPGGGLVFLSAGDNGIVDTNKDRITSGEATGDDIVQIVTRRL